MCAIRPQLSTKPFQHWCKCSLITYEYVEALGLGVSADDTGSTRADDASVVLVLGVDETRQAEQVTAANFNHIY